MNLQVLHAVFIIYSSERVNCPGSALKFHLIYLKNVQTRVLYCGAKCGQNDANLTKLFQECCWFHFEMQIINKLMASKRYVYSLYL